MATANKGRPVPGDLRDSFHSDNCSSLLIPKSAIFHVSSQRSTIAVVEQACRRPE
jgi:hypothetical protein